MLFRSRNMATGASNSELAVILVDARKGVLPQTKRHAFLCSLLGIRQIVLACNKMDLVAFEQRCFDDIATRFSASLRISATPPSQRFRSRHDLVTMSPRSRLGFRGIADPL